MRTVPAEATILVLSLCGLVSALQFTLVIPLLPELPDLLAISASASSFFALRTRQTTPASPSSPANDSDSSTLLVPTRTGRPVSRRW